MTTWNEAFIQTLVTDKNSLSDGEKLARSNKWNIIENDQRSTWAEAQGSGKKPYLVCIDLQDGATKCSCPSRKFPCKHAIGLMLLFVRGKAQAGTPPEWVTTWLDGRDRKREATVSKPTKAPDPAAQAKREAARITKVTAGIDELRLFLEDFVRQGGSDPRAQSYEFWDRISARMVDAQMQPIGARLSELGGLAYQKKTDWMSQLWDEIARLYTLTEAYQRIDSLPEPLAHDIRGAIGFTLKQEDILANGESVTDRWQILGVYNDAQNALKERRTWLYGENSQRYALIQDFAHNTRPFDAYYPYGQAFTGEIVYYPSAYPQRALVKQINGSYNPIPPDSLKFEQSVEAILENYANALAINPFVRFIPAGLTQTWTMRGKIIDIGGAQLPLKKSAQTQWFNAVAGGNWIPTFGEWDGLEFQLTTLIADEGWLEMGEV